MHKLSLALAIIVTALLLLPTVALRPTGSPQAAAAVAQATPAPSATPPSPPESDTSAARLTYQTVAALVCLFGISIFTVAGGLAMKRRFDAISPDE